MFRISNFGILAEDFESTLADSDCVFQSSSVFLHRIDDHRDEFVWCPSMQVLARTRKYGRLRYGNNVAIQTNLAYEW